MDELQAVLATYFDALHRCDRNAFHAMWHPQGVLLGLGPSGLVVARDADEFCAGVVSRGASPELAKHDSIMALERIDSTCASAKVCIALPPAPGSPTPTTEPTLYTDWLTLLKDPKLGWRVVAKVYSSRPLGALADVEKIVPSDFASAATAVWDGYVAAGRACDGTAMSRIFHPVCNLTFVTPEEVVVIGSIEFCERVATRWTMDAHRPFAHLKDDFRVAACDTLLSLDFVGPAVARATLRIGFPPFLYTDVLLLLKLSAKCNGRDGWWVVAKSSGHVPFLIDAEVGG
mmetsp:Transcript_17087/g.30499  ORF Transcript_17087/g.30499 Transcript_17087/m.30499 type:complete len:288 (-) Transcript_17087:696-1559(-)